MSSFATYASLVLPLPRQNSALYRNQSTDLLCKSMEWFQYDCDPSHERVKSSWSGFVPKSLKISIIFLTETIFESDVVEN